MATARKMPARNATAVYMARGGPDGSVGTSAASTTLTLSTPMTLCAVVDRTVDISLATMAAASGLPAVTEMLMTRVVVPASTEILYPLSEDMPRASAVRFCTVSDFAKVAMSFAMSWLAVRSLYAVVLEELASSFAVSTYTDTVAVYWFCMRPQLKPAVAIASTTGSTTTRARCLRSSLNSSSSVIRSSFSSASYVRCLLTCR